MNEIKIKHLLLSIFLTLIITVPALSEVIYLKDGQIVSGAIISESKELVTLKGKYKNYEFKREDILRILYGARNLEMVYILMKDYSIIQVFLVDQDNKKVTIRRKQESPEEENISKENIRQISNEKIILFFPEVSLRMGVFRPLNTKSGSNLDPAYIPLGGFSMRLPFIKRSRLQFETGYVKNTATYNDYTGTQQELSLQTIPLLLNYIYTYNMTELIHTIKGGGDSGSITNINFINKFIDRTNLFGKFGLGLSYLIFDNGEGDKYNGLFLSSILGAGLSFEIIKMTLFLQFESDFLFIMDKEAMLVPLIYSVSLNYRY